jgi:hypothetical protein
MGAEVEQVLRFEPFLGVVLSKPVSQARQLFDSRPIAK